MSKKIVVIDDEKQIRRMLKIALSSAEYDVYEAENGEQGLALIARHLPDAVILDLGLPDMDGQEVLNDLREWSPIPVIVLSVRSAESEKVTALDNGAQDYVTKPFSVEELLARLRACLRDSVRPDVQPVIELGNIKIDISQRRVTKNGVEVDLTPKEYAVLTTLAKSQGRVITQTQLLTEIWGKTHSEDTHYLRIVVSHIRQKLGDDPNQPEWLRTEPGVGYRLLM